MSHSLRVVSIAAASLFFVACDDWGNFGDSQRFKEDFHHSYEVKPGARIALENINGSVEIMGWEKNTVDVAGTKYAADESLLKATRIDIVASADSVSVRTVPPSGWRGNL